MLRKSLIREGVGFVFELALRGAVGLAAGIVVSAIEAYPAFGIALSKRMTLRDIERLNQAFEGVAFTEPPESPIRKGMH